jgi:hypothetical protein
MLFPLTCPIPKPLSLSALFKSSPFFLGKFERQAIVFYSFYLSTLGEGVVVYAPVLVQIQLFLIVEVELAYLMVVSSIVGLHNMDKAYYQVEFVFCNYYNI